MATATPKPKMVTDHPKARKDKLAAANLSQTMELTPEEVERVDAAPEEVTGKRLADWITKAKPLPKGKSPTKELSDKAKPKQNGNGNGAAPKSRPDDRYAALAREAIELAGATGKKLGSPITRPQSKVIVDMLKKPRKAWEPIIDKTNKKDLLAYAQGGSRADLPEELSTAIRDFCKTADDRRIWPRKVAALALIVQDAK